MAVPHITQDDRKALAARAYRDPVFFCKFFLPELFPMEIPWVHRGLLAILTGRCEFLVTDPQLDKIIRNFSWFDEEEVQHFIFTKGTDEDGNPTLNMTLNKYTLIMLPRGFAKTTIAGIAVPLIEILYQECPFTVYVSESANHSKMQLANVKREISDNAKIKAVFGDLVPGLKEVEKWSEDFIETRTGVAAAARGRGGQLRGLNHRGNRPGKIIVDDVEDKESVSTEAQREKTRTWAYADLMPALPRVKGEGTIVALGTLLGSDCLLETWRKDPVWTVVKMGALDADGELLWAANMNVKDLEVTKRSYALAGNLHLFYMEYFNEARSPEDQLFRQEFFQYCPPEGTLSTAIYVDPAISANRRADHAVISVWGISQSGLLWKLDQWGGLGKTPREIVDNYFRLSKLWNCRRHGVESNAYQAALVHLLREEMFRKKQYFEIEAVTHKTKKEDRIIGILVPRYSAGYVRHARKFPESEIQAIDFRRGIEQKDDYLDADAGCVALLDPWAAQAAGKDLSADEYPPLEEVLGGSIDWC